MHPVLFHLGAVVIPAYGAMTALGVLLALFLAQRTARALALDTGQVWNLCVIALFAALVGERILLVAINLETLGRHPSWALALAMVHHPLLAAAGAVAGGGAAALYARRKGMPFSVLADALAAPLSLGLAFEQAGALLAGSGWGVDAFGQLPWAITYSSPLAARWSGTPLGMALHPVQAYASLGFLVLAVAAFLALWWRRQSGDVAGFWLMGFGAVVFFTEIWRDAEGRGQLLDGALDAPQVAALAAVIVGAWLLLERTEEIEK